MAGVGVSGFVRIPAWVGEFVIGAARLLDVEYTEVPGIRMHRWAQEPGMAPIIESVETSHGLTFAALDTGADPGVGSS